MATLEEFLATFRHERDLFARWDPRVGAAMLEFSPVDRCIKPDKCAFRDLAYAEPDRMVITFHPCVLGFPLENQVGLTRHELGHLVDRATPYVVNTGREQIVDDIAERVTGQRVYYDRNLVQTTAQGIWPRPLGIHW